MKNQNIEPFVGILKWPLKFDCFLLERQIEPLVLDMTDTIKSDSCLTPFEKHWNYFDFFDIFDLPKVVEVVIDAGLIETGEHVEASWVIMVPVNAIDRKFYAQRRR